MSTRGVNWWLELFDAADDYVTHHGQHEGSCTNEAPWDDGGCDLHVESSARREGRVKAAIRAIKEDRP